MCEKIEVELIFGTDHVDWEEAVTVVERAPLGKRSPEMFRKACENSCLLCTAYSEGQLVGLGRAISDTVWQSAIYDLVVLPEYQGQGIGARIMQSLLERLPSGPVLMYVVPGKENFYRKLGFEPLRTALDASQTPKSKERMDTLLEQDIKRRREAI